MQAQERVKKVVEYWFLDVIDVILNKNNKEKTLVTRKFVEQAFLEFIVDKEEYKPLMKMHPNYFKKCITIGIKLCGWEHYANGARNNRIFRRVKVSEED